jgi:hypothetical protein
MGPCTAAQMWEAWVDSVAEDASPLLLRCMQRAFYGGICSLLVELEERAGDRDQQAFFKAWEALAAEVHAFAFACRVEDSQLHIRRDICYCRKNPCECLPDPPEI